MHLYMKICTTFHPSQVLAMWKHPCWISFSIYMYLERNLCWYGGIMCMYIYIYIINIYHRMCRRIMSYISWRYVHKNALTKTCMLKNWHWEVSNIKVTLFLLSPDFPPRTGMYRLPETRVFKKETSLPTIHFQVRAVSFREVIHPPCFFFLPPACSHTGCKRRPTVPHARSSRSWHFACRPGPIKDERVPVYPDPGRE